MINVKYMILFMCLQNICAIDFLLLHMNALQ